MCTDLQGSNRCLLKWFAPLPSSDLLVPSGDAFAKLRSVVAHLLHNFAKLKSLCADLVYVFATLQSLLAYLVYAFAKLQLMFAHLVHAFYKLQFNVPTWYTPFTSSSIR